MNDKRISVFDAADELGLVKQTAFKILSRLGITPTKTKSEHHRGQAISFISKAEIERLADYQSPPSSDDSEVATDSGVFYLIQLEPSFDPGRFKLGFTPGLENRLRHLRCSAPFAIVVRTWPCKQLWEKTAMDCIARGCSNFTLKFLESNQ